MSDVLTCECGALELEIIAQSYGDGHAFEGYKCAICGRTGSLTYDELTGTILDGCLR